ncbi:hypothetical protein [Tessaracoccus sp. Z1128]
MHSRATLGRRRLRLAAAFLAGIIAVLYVTVFFIQLPHLREADNPAPLYAFLAVAYAVGAGLLVLRDNRLLHGVGAGIQVLVVGGFVWLFVELSRHGEESFVLDMLWLAVSINALQIVLFGILAVLVAGRPDSLQARLPH